MIAPLAALLRLHELQTSGEAESPMGRREEARLLQPLSSALLEQYQNLQRRYGDSAIVPMERRICKGCYMRQPAIPEEVEEDVHVCQNCSRLLYDPDVAFGLSVG